MSARARVLLAIAAIVVALASPPLVGFGVAIIAVLAGRSFRAPFFVVAITVALQAWLAGWHAALALGARVAGATAIANWLVASARPDEIVRALGELGLPRALVELTALAARYVSVLGEALRTAREAQRVRLGWQRLGARVRSFGALGGVVLGRAVDQSVAIGEAMRARGGGQS